MTIQLWHYLPTYEKFLKPLVQNMKEDSIDDATLQIRKVFGTRLERLFLIGKRKFHPTLIKRLRNRKHCGIFVYTLKSKAAILDIVHRLGWSRKSKIHIMETFPGKNYFEYMTEYDLIIFRKGPIPNEIDVYCVDLKERSKIAGQTSNVNNPIQLLRKYVQTYIGGNNPFYKSDLVTIVGIGGTLRAFPEWYLAFESYGQEFLFDSVGQPQLENISRYYARIGCWIPGCLENIEKEAKYWHQHTDPEFPLESIRNEIMLQTKTLVSFGYAYRVECVLTCGKKRRILVPIDIYQIFFDEDQQEYLPESTLFLCQTYSGREYPITDSEIAKVEILRRENNEAMEYRRTAFQTMQEGILDGGRPNLVLISPKGTFKSTFMRFCIDNQAKVLFIDSDDFGIEITKAILLDQNQTEIIPDEKENVIINWFRKRLEDFEIPIEQMSVSDFETLGRLDVLLTDFSIFWKKIYDKGYGDVPGFNNYIDARIREARFDFRIVVTLTHNLFEARLCQSKVVLTVNAGVQTQTILNKRAHENQKTVSHLIADMLYQRYSLSSKFLFASNVGWGDVIGLISDLGVLSPSKR